MFNLLGSKPSNKVSYKVYLTKIAKYRQLTEQLVEAVAQGLKVHLVAHFDQTHNELIQLLTRANIEFDQLESGLTNYPVILSKSEALRTRSQMPNDEFQLIVAEIHPTTIREESLKKLHKGEMIIFCALDNPFFEILGGERIRKLMGKLGLKENEAIEHSMVTKAIVNAQMKMDKKARNEKPAASIREWMNLNT